MKKRAKFVVEVEYEGDIASLDPDNVKVVNYEQEGDYGGLTLALTAGMLFHDAEGDTPFQSFKKKLRVLRAVASTFMNGIQAFRDKGLIDDKQMDKEQVRMVSEIYKYTTNVLSYGIAILQGLNDEQVGEANTSEFTDVPTHPDFQNNKDEEERDRRPSEDDFL